MTPTLIGIDIGGTKTKLGVVRVAASGLMMHRIVLEQEIPTPKESPETFYDHIAAAVLHLRTSASQPSQTVLPIIAMAHPGRFLPDGRLARGTTPNLGTAAGQFDGIDPAAELSRRLGWRVVAENDAIAQMRYGLDVLLEDPAVRPQLLGETVVYLGPGTGMGGGVARVNGQGKVTPVTDGHFFDMQIPGYEDGSYTTEEIMTGPAIAKRVQEENRQLKAAIEPARGGTLDEILQGALAPPEHLAVARRIAEEHGKLLALTIMAIHAGQIRKVRLERTTDGKVLRHVDEPDRAWPEADRVLVRGVRRLIFGAFVGSSKGLGKLVRSTALEHLRRQGLVDIEIFQIPATSADAGLLGIVQAIPTSDIRKALSDTAP